MPVAALPPSNTARVWVDYTIGGEDHSIQARWEGPGGDVAALSTFAEFFAFLSPSLYLVNITGARVASAGSDVTNPVTWPGSASYGAGSPPAGQQMKMITMVGKDTSGHRVRFMVFGITINIPPTWRAAPTINSDLSDAYDHLFAAGSAGTFLSIAGNSFILNNYVNFKFYDGDIKKVRS